MYTLINLKNNLYKFSNNYFKNDLVKQKKNDLNIIENHHVIVVLDS